MDIRHLYIRSIALLVLLSGPLVVYAQRQWTLDDCLEYAETHNLNIERLNTLVSQRKTALDASRSARLPSLNAQIGENLVFADNPELLRAIMPDGMAEALDTRNDMSMTTATLDFSVPLYNGGKTVNRIKADEYALSESSASRQNAVKNLQMQVSVYYLNCLYYRSLANVAREQVRLSESLTSKARSMVREGVRPESDLVDAEAQLAADEFALSDAEGVAALALLDLAQILNVEPDGFDISDPDIESQAESILLPSADELFSSASVSYPSIREMSARISADEYRLKMAKGDYLPKLSFDAKAFTSYDAFFHKGYAHNAGSQLDRNLIGIVGLQLDIPIFNAFQARTQVRMSEYSLKNSETDLNQAKQNLKKDIQKAYYNASVAQRKLQSAEKAVKAAEMSELYERKKFDSGKGNIFDLQTAGQKLLQARQNELQTRYEFLIRYRILTFYQN